MDEKVLVIVPAFNEQGSIQDVLKQIRDVSKNYDIAVVNDCSADDTAKVANENAEILLSHSINLGAGAAIQTGLKYACINNYDLAIIVDGDGQHDPKYIPILIDALKKTSADIVIGSRFLSNNHLKIHWARRIGIFIFANIASYIGRSKITDTTSGFRVFNRKTIKFLSKEIPMDFPDADMLLSLLFSGFKIIEVPVEMRDRQNGRSMYSALKSIYYPFKLVVAILTVLLRKLIIKERME